MKKFVTLLTLALLATCFAFASSVNNNAAMVNTTAITDTGPALANTLVVNEVATIETATAANLAAGTEKKNVFDTMTMHAATTATNANAKAAYGAPRKVAIKAVANGAGTVFKNTKSITLKI